MTQRLTVSRLSVAIVIVLSLFLAAIPQPAQAATCRTYHYVQEGDTTVKIAKTYGLRWREIADANNLDYPYDLDEGDRLCIPFKDADEDDDDDADATEFRMSVTATHTAINITVSGLNVKKAAFNVRVRNANTGVGGWVKLGKFKAEKKESKKMVFSVPAELRNVLYIQVCLKNLSTDELTCKTVIHP